VVPSAEPINVVPSAEPINVVPSAEPINVLAEIPQRTLHVFRVTVGRRCPEGWSDPQE
jgi:hypothetical protein